MNKKEWVANKAGNIFVGLDNLAYEFYYKAMHDNGMDLSDADRYAWLNTLFGYDIGAEHAAGIINWFYKRDMDVLEIVGGLESKHMMEDSVMPDLGYHLDFQYWVWDEPDYISYNYMATPIIKKRIDKRFADGYTIDNVCGCICGLFHDNLIDEAQEDELYIYADPDDKMDIAPYEAWCEFDEENPLNYTEGD